MRSVESRTGRVRWSAGRRTGGSALFRLCLTVSFGLCLSLCATAARAGYADIVIDADSGQVFHATAPDTRNYPASLTKMMTLYLLFDALDRGKVALDQSFTVSAHAAAQAPSRLGLAPGDTIPVRDIIPVIVTKSANDMAVTVAENLAGSESRFAQMMTAQARKLGMTQTTFRNASGLPIAGQMTTARDMARLAQALIHDHARYYPYFRTQSYTYNGIEMANHNHLMSRYPGMDGLKTGYIAASGFNLVGSAVHGGRRLIAVVMGGESAVARDNRMAELLDTVFDDSPPPLALAPVLPPGAASRAPTQKTRRPAPEPAPERAYEPVPPAPSAAAPPPAAPPSASATWSIQIGAYAARGAGEQALATIRQSLGDGYARAVPVLLPVGTSGGTLFRARLTGLDEAAARAACARLSHLGRSCLPIAPTR